MTDSNNLNGKILLTGATGYVGGRLLGELLRRGRSVRCLARRPEHLAGRLAPEVETVAGDVLDAASLDRAMEGVQTAYYLVHSMGSAGSFEEADRLGAENFARAAATAGVRRIIYLGGLGNSSASLSAHLRSRQEVGEILRRPGVQVVEFRASIVLGSGSLSFEMIRALTERLPVMITPRWVHVMAQPISINDLLRYLVGGLELDFEGSPIFEIGGADQISYAGLMREYARQRGLRRWMIPVPLLTPRLSSLWLGLVTPIYARVGRKLIDSIRLPTVVRDPSAIRVFGFRPIAAADAIAAAMRREDQELAETRWSDALSAAGPPREYGGVRFGNRLVDSRVRRVAATPEAAFAPIRRIGGAAGWYYWNGLWRARGWLDLLAGGIGIRRGRRDPERLRVGDVVDWWRVEAYEENRRLRLAAEMRLPGRAWLEYEIEPVAAAAAASPNGGDSARECVIRQTAIFDPGGLAGLLYWYSVYPLHALIFAGMLREIVERAKRAEADSRSA